MPHIMSLDLNWLLLSMLISTVGVGLFLYGRNVTSLPYLLVGGICCIYPYLISNLLLMALIAVLLGAGLWAMVRMGW